MAYRHRPKEAILEGQRARLGGGARSNNPDDRPFVLTGTNEPEFKAAARLREAWYSGWDSIHAQLEASARGDQKQVDS